MIKQNASARITPSQIRQEIAAMLGIQYGGNRDVYEQAGYPKVITFEEYLGMYRRADIAGVVVSEPAKESWRSWPEILDGTSEDDARDDTQFAKDWKALTVGRFDIDREMLGIYHYLLRLDIRSGIGQYGGLLLGLNDGAANAKDPLTRGAARGIDALLYLTVFDEGQMEVIETNEDKSSPRYGLPEIYKLKTNDGFEEVHWTRIIHAAEGGEILGESRLEGVFNRLKEIEKIMAASGESAWRLMVPRLASMAREGFQQGDDDDTDQAFQDFIHGLTRVLSVDGADLEEFTGSIVDPSGALAACIRLISGRTRIPQRKLIGAEAGQLASSQDDDNWIAYIDSRRRNHVEPVILKRTISRLVYAGVIARPTKGIIVKWPELRKINRLELAELGNKAADALVKLGLAPDLADFLVAYLPDLDPSKTAYQTSTVGGAGAIPATANYP